MQHRTIARIFGIIDMVLSVLYSVLLIMLLILLAVLGGVFFKTIDDSASDNYNDNNAETAGTFFFAAIGIVFLVVSVLCFLKIFASWKLLKGTAHDVDPTGGLRFCAIWRGVTIFFVVLKVLGCISWFVWGASTRYMNHLESNLQLEALNDITCK